MTELARRVERAQALLDAWRDKPFRWGTRDCARLVAAALRRMGHQVKLPASGSYASPRSALKVLAARGAATMIEAIDQLGLERIAPAAALPCDIIALPGEGPLGSLGVALTNGRVLGFHEELKGAGVLQPIEYVCAWRVPDRG